MFTLYRMEMKKLWKRCVNRLCILLFLFFILYLGYSTYERYFNIRGLSDASVHKDGEIYTGFAAIREIDQTHHERYMDIESFDPIAYEEQKRVFEVELQKLMDAREIDEVQMRDHYGVDWKELYKACQEQTLTYGVFQPENQSHNKQEIVPLDAFPLFYTKESESLVDSFLELERPQISDQWIDRDAYLLTREKVDMQLQIQSEDPTSVSSNNKIFKILLPSITKAYSEEEMNAINERFLAIDTLFDASGGYDYFICGAESLQATFLFALILLAILLCGIFNQENSTGVDQITHPVKQGSRKQAIAKVLAGMSITAILCMLTILCVWGVPYLMVGFYSLEQPILEFPITMKENMILFLLLFSVSCFSYGSFMLLVSSYTKNSFIALLLVLIWILATSFLGYLPINETLVHLLPGSFIIPPFDYEIVSMFGMMILRGYLVCAGWGMVSIGFLYVAYRHYKTRDIQNA